MIEKLRDKSKKEIIRICRENKMSYMVYDVVRADGISFCGKVNVNDYYRETVLSTRFLSEEQYEVIIVEIMDGFRNNYSNENILSTMLFISSGRGGKLEYINEISRF